jgi:hypothetical protein
MSNAPPHAQAGSEDSRGHQLPHYHLLEQGVQVVEVTERRVVDFTVAAIFVSPASYTTFLEFNLLRTVELLPFNVLSSYSRTEPHP